MWLGHVHRHVEVVAAGLERSVEDGWVHARVAGVHDDVGTHALCQLHDLGSIRGIKAGAAYTVAAGLCRCHSGAGGIDVGQHDVGEDRSTCGDCCKRGSNSAGTDNENSHKSRG